MSPSPVDATARDDRPSLAKRIAFRFVTIYFVAFFFPVPFDAPFESPGAPAWYARLCDPAVNGIGRLLGVRVPLSIVDAGDSLGSYVALLGFAALALAAAIGWSLADRRRPRDRVAHDLLLVDLRYALAGALFAFGFAKVFPSQMPLPEPERLLDTYGRSAPMTLLWTFMGASPTYERFTGAAEVLAGLLLLTRRTTPLGALVASAVTLHVVVINVAYDVYLKQYATHLFLVSVLLLAPSVPRLFDALVRGRAVPAVAVETPVPAQWRRAALALKIAFVGGMLFTQASIAARHHYEDANAAPLPDLYGIFDVEEMRRGGELVPPLLTDSTYWHHVYFGRWKSGVELADGSRATLTVSRAGADAWTLKRDDGATLSLTRASDGTLRIEGIAEGAPISVRARPTDVKNIRLVRWRFHWIRL